jgi:hypothetical protein
MSTQQSIGVVLIWIFFLITCPLTVADFSQAPKLGSLIVIIDTIIGSVGVLLLNNQLENTSSHITNAIESSVRKVEDLFKR